MSGEDDRSRKNKAVSGFVKELVLFMANSRLYEATHPRVQETMDRARAEKEKYFQEFGGKSFSLGVAGDFLVFQGEPLLGVSISAVDFIGGLAARGLTGLSFSRGLDAQDLQALCTFLSGTPAGPPDQALANKELADLGCHNIRVLRKSPDGPRPEGAVATAGPGEEGGSEPAGASSQHFAVDLAAEGALPAYQGMISYLQRQGVRVSRGEALEVSLGRKCVEKVRETMRRDSPGLFRLARYDQYDPMALGHSAGVCLLCLRLGEGLLEREEDIVRLGLAGLVHDIGNNRLPFDIFMSQEKLDSSQWVTVEKHCDYGAEILATADEVDSWLVAAAFGHHRAPAGEEGYPQALPGCPISTIARLVKICDIFEALTAPRSHRRAFTPVEAYRLMLDMGEQLDRGLLKRFISLIGIYPVGYTVMLTDGREALVVAQGDRPECPQVLTEGAGDRICIASGTGRGGPGIMALVEGDRAPAANPV